MYKTKKRGRRRYRRNSILDDPRGSRFATSHIGLDRNKRVMLVRIVEWNGFLDSIKIFEGPFQDCESYAVSKYNANAMNFDGENFNYVLAARLLIEN